MSNGLSQSLGHLLQHDTNLRSQRQQRELFGLELGHRQAMHSDEVALRQRDLARLERIASWEQDDRVATQNREDLNAAATRDLTGAQTDAVRAGIARADADSAAQRDRWGAETEGFNTQNQGAQFRLEQEKEAARRSRAGDIYNNAVLAREVGYPDEQVRSQLAFQLAPLLGKPTEELMGMSTEELTQEARNLSGGLSSFVLERERQRSLAGSTATNTMPSPAPEQVNPMLDDSRGVPGSFENQVQYATKKFVTKLQEAAERSFGGDMNKLLQNRLYQRQIRMFLSNHPSVIRTVKDRPLANKEDPFLSLIDIGGGWASGLIRNDKGEHAPLTPGGGRYTPQGDEYSSTVMAFSPSDMFTALQLLAEGGQEAFAQGMSAMEDSVAPSGTYVPKDFDQSALAALLQERSDTRLGLGPEDVAGNRDSITAGIGVGPIADQNRKVVEAHGDAAARSVNQAPMSDEEAAVVEGRQRGILTGKVNQASKELAAAFGKNQPRRGIVFGQWHESWSRGGDNWRGSLEETIAADMQITLSQPGVAELVARDLGFLYPEGSPNAGKPKPPHRWSAAEHREFAELLKHARKSDEMNNWPRASRDTFGYIDSGMIAAYLQNRVGPQSPRRGRRWESFDRFDPERVGHRE